MAKKKMKRMNVENGVCCHSSCSCKKHIGIAVLVLGVLILLNALYGWLNWGVFIGGIVAIKGIIMLAHGNICCK